MSRCRGCRRTPARPTDGERFPGGPRCRSPTGHSRLAGPLGVASPDGSLRPRRRRAARSRQLPEPDQPQVQDAHAPQSPSGGGRQFFQEIPEEPSCFLNIEIEHHRPLGGTRRHPSRPPRRRLGRTFDCDFHAALPDGFHRVLHGNLAPVRVVRPRPESNGLRATCTGRTHIPPAFSGSARAEPAGASMTSRPARTARLYAAQGPR
jgi:hypothetical protein